MPEFCEKAPCWDWSSSLVGNIFQVKINKHHQYVNTCRVLQVTKVDSLLGDLAILIETKENAV